MPDERVVGIDLGTTFSSVAVLGDDGKPYAVLNAEGSPTTPSVAIWHDGAYVVGQPALDLVARATGPERDRLAGDLIRGVKRMITAPPEGGLISAGRRTTPIEVSAAILAKLARDASARLGFPVRDAVITVPAHFGDRERSATKEAAMMAGLRVAQIMNEPTAAALMYSHGDVAQPGTALVFDLGGGTFDATVLELGDTPHVLATSGIEELGGITFTTRLARDLRQRYEAETGAAYPKDSDSEDTLMRAAETAKCALSEAESTRITLAPAHGAPRDFEITRERFEQLIRLYLVQLKTAVELAVDGAHKTPSQISRVLLCGGSSRVPAVQQMLTELFHRPPEKVLDLDLSVALGAAYQAANSDSGPGLELSIRDCVTYAVGIAVRDTYDLPVKLVLLNAGDPLDTWSTPYAVRIAGSAKNFPPIAVYRGAGVELNERDRLGEIPVELPADVPRGAPAFVQMMQDQSGLVEVRLTLAGERRIPGDLRRP